MRAIQRSPNKNNSGHYKTSHGFKINFVNATKVTPHEIPKMMYNFTMFDDIVSGSTNTDFLIVSQVVLCGSHWLWSLRIVLIGMFMVLWCCCSVWLKSKKQELTTIMCTQIGNQILGSSVYSLVDHFLHNAHVKCFDELSQLKKECMYVIVATISKLLVANGWIYDGCPKCNKKAYGEGSSFVCVGCGNKSASIVAKFHVDVRVGQPHDSAIFTLWDCECYALIKEIATEIKLKMLMRDILKELDRVYRKRLAFRFKVAPDNTRHSVSQLFEDDALIEFVLPKLLALQH
ncbi:hypothetical protein GmHk_20G056909 [Glycine max]|nr:hypothetical protein GmHk_20G056909 [Glycine max]